MGFQASCSVVLPCLFAIRITFVFNTPRHGVFHVLLQIKPVQDKQSLDPHSLPASTALLLCGAREGMGMGVPEILVPSKNLQTPTILIKIQQLFLNKTSQFVLCLWSIFSTLKRLL